MKKTLSIFAIAGMMASFNVGPATAQSLTDPQIAHAAYTADVLDIAYGQIALEKSNNAEVRKFAELMIKDHTAANEAALALVKKLGVTPEDNAFSQTLAKNGEAKKAELRGLSGAAFDKAYAQNEYAYHDVVVKTVAEKWIPTIQNAEFKKFMTDANEIFKVHLQHAKQMAENVK
jgi:putative membrane protein